MCAYGQQGSTLAHKAKYCSVAMRVRVQRPLRTASLVGDPGEDAALLRAAGLRDLLRGRALFGRHGHISGAGRNLAELQLAGGGREGSSAAEKSHEKGRREGVNVRTRRFSLRCRHPAQGEAPKTRKGWLWAGAHQAKHTARARNRSILYAVDARSRRSRRSGLNCLSRPSYSP